MIATGIQPRHLHLAWPALAPLLEMAVKFTPEKPDVLARLIAGDAQLWAVYDGARPVAAITTQITLHPLKRLRIWLVGGSRVREWISDFLDKAEDYARAMGCVGIWAAGRDGWTRIAARLGYGIAGSVEGWTVWERRFA